MHCEQSGVTDHFARNEYHALKITRDIVSNLGPDPTIKYDPYKEPLYDINDIPGILPESIY